MAIVFIKCDGDHSVHAETLRIRELLTELGLVPVAIGPGTARNLKLSFAVELKTDAEAKRLQAALGDSPQYRSG